MRRSWLRRHALVAVALSAACNAPLVLAEAPVEAGASDASVPSLGETPDTGAEDTFVVIQNMPEAAPVEDARADAMDAMDAMDGDALSE